MLIVRLLTLLIRFFVNWILLFMTLVLQKRNGEILYRIIFEKRKEDQYGKLIFRNFWMIFIPIHLHQVLFQGVLDVRAYGPMMLVLWKRRSFVQLHHFINQQQIGNGRKKCFFNDYYFIDYQQVIFYQI